MPNHTYNKHDIFTKAKPKKQDEQTNIDIYKVAGHKIIQKIIPRQKLYLFSQRILNIDILTFFYLDMRCITHLNKRNMIKGQFFHEKNVC